MMWYVLSMLKYISLVSWNNLPFCYQRISLFNGAQICFAPIFSWGEVIIWKLWTILFIPVLPFRFSCYDSLVASRKPVWYSHGIEAALLLALSILSLMWGHSPVLVFVFQVTFPLLKFKVLVYRKINLKWQHSYSKSLVS